MRTKVTWIEREVHATDQLFLLGVASPVFVTILTDSFEKLSVGIFQSSANREEV
jgi:hypothetical protein